MPDEELLQIVDAGRRAPSGYNRQPWEFIVIQDHSILAQLGRIQACIADSSAAIENMLLAVVALGYASLWVEGYVLQHEEYGKQVLGVPERLRLLAVLPIGMPASPPVQAGKKDIKKITYTNRYGNPWQR